MTVKMKGLIPAQKVKALLALTVFLHGCRSYEPTTIATAEEMESKVRVTTLEGRKYTGVFLRRKGNSVQGLKRVGGVLDGEQGVVFEVPLEEIRSVEAVDKKDTLIRNLLFFGITGGVVIWMVSEVDEGISLDTTN